MGLLDEVKKTRDESKAAKRNQLLESTIYVIKNGTYKFNFGVNSAEEFQELKEVISELNEELKEDKFVLKLAPDTMGVRSSTGYSVYACGKTLGTFYYYLTIEVDAL